MSTELKARAHVVRPGQTVIEIWWQGLLVGVITETDHFPGVRILTKYPLTYYEREKVAQLDINKRSAIAVNVSEIRLDVPGN